MSNPIVPGTEVQFDPAATPKADSLDAVVTAAGTSAQGGAVPSYFLENMETLAQKMKITFSSIPGELVSLIPYALTITKAARFDHYGIKSSTVQSSHIRAFFTGILNEKNVTVSTDSISDSDFQKLKQIDLRDILNYAKKVNELPKVNHYLEAYRGL